MKHTMVDCYGVNRYILDDIKFINDTLNYMASYLEVFTVSPPVIVPYYYGVVEEDAGISAYVFLKGGHITIHTFPLRECYFLDIVCEKDYDENKVYSFLSKELPFDNDKSLFITVDREVKNDSMIPTTKEDFGPHVLAQIKVEKDLDMTKISNFLESIVPTINMHPITRAFVIYDNVTDPTYLSGIIMIAESHIAIHYNLKTKVIYFDLFSCMMFDTSGLTNILEDNFGEVTSCQLTVRGTKNKYKRNNKINDKTKYINSRWASNY